MFSWGMHNLASSACTMYFSTSSSSSSSRAFSNSSNETAYMNSASRPFRVSTSCSSCLMRRSAIFISASTLKTPSSTCVRTSTSSRRSSAMEARSSNTASPLANLDWTSACRSQRSCRVSGISATSGRGNAPSRPSYCSVVNFDISELEDSRLFASGMPLSSGWEDDCDDLSHLLDDMSSGRGTDMCRGKDICREDDTGVPCGWTKLCTAIFSTDKTAMEIATRPSVDDCTIVVSIDSRIGGRTNLYCGFFAGAQVPT
mmetsp:Transcript_24274/g.51998  ORF Transcript_24274/g.51998 Transcript_24274/m.51998 type:complete len:258 (+) Transcript_24274:262-1035(+)